MPMQPIYLVAIKNLPNFLEALRHAQAPEKVSLRYIEELGFTSTNDRLFIPLLKAMKFIEESGKPTTRYHAFLDGTQWKHVLAEGIKDAYHDLFRVNRNAHMLGRDALAGKIKSLTEGKPSASVLQNTTKTFLELVKLADFSPSEPEDIRDSSSATSSAPITNEETSTAGDRQRASAPTTDARSDSSPIAPTLVYRIEIVLPAVRDQAVYDAIFRSAREHLIK